jgi:hypothetical protein
MTNSKRWQDNSDGWVSDMNKSKDNKLKYVEYLKTVLINTVPLSYRAWAKARRNLQ